MRAQKKEERRKHYEKFRKWLKSRGYAPKTVYGVYTTLIKIAEQMGDPNTITIEEVRRFYWLSNHKVRSQCLHSFRLYREFLNDGGEK